MPSSSSDVESCPQCLNGDPEAASEIGATSMDQARSSGTTSNSQLRSGNRNRRRRSSSSQGGSRSNRREGR